MSKAVVLEAADGTGEVTFRPWQYLSTAKAESLRVFLSYQHFEWCS
jgi:hypothetical protein